jgi:hypothetical protein
MRQTLWKRQAERVEQGLAQLRGRLEKAYVDRWDGKISEELWEAKSVRPMARGQTGAAGTLAEREQAACPRPRARFRPCE